MPAAATSWGKILKCTALSLEARGLPAGIRAFSAAVAQEAKAPSAPKNRHERCTTWVAPIRPDAATQRRQLSAYKQQVHELRVQYIKELEAKKQVEQESKKAASRLSDTDMAAYAQARAEHAEAKKVRLAQRMKAIQKYKDERKLVTQISFNAASTKREEKYLSKFSNVALEAKTWCASEDAVDALIQDALVNVNKPRFYAPQRKSW